MLRLLLAGALIALALACVWLSWGPLRNLFADYRDGSVIVYALFGGVFLAMAAAALVVAVRLLRRPPPR